MATSGPFDAFITFVLEAIRLIGWPKLLLAVVAPCVAGGVALWLASKVLCRGEKHLAASLTAPLIVPLLGVMVGAVYLTTLLRESPPNENSNSLFLVGVCGAVALVLLFLGLQGGFGTNGLKTALLVIVLLGSVAGTSKGLASFALGDEPAKLALLADQVSGRTAEGPWMVESAAATKRIQIRRAPIEKTQLENKQALLLRVYQGLQAERVKLDVNDAAAVAAFNAKAAAYTTESNAVKAKLVAVQALILEGAAEEPKEAQK